jgi:hypothetical protein
VDTSRTNLLVFISPRVVETGKDVDSLSIEKMEHMEREKSRYDQEVQSEQPWFMEHAPKKENSDEQEKDN